MHQIQIETKKNTLDREIDSMDFKNKQKSCITCLSLILQCTVVLFNQSPSNTHTHSNTAEGVCICKHGSNRPKAHLKWFLYLLGVLQ